MRLLTVPVLLAALGGQAPAASLLSRVGKVAWAPVRYAAARGQDLLDVFEINVGFGRTAKIDVKYGLHFFRVGDVRAWRAGSIDRRMGTWRETDDGLSIFPVSLLGWPVHWAADACGCRRLATDARFVARECTEGYQHVDRKELNGDPAFLWKDTVGGYYGPIHGVSLPTGFRHTRWGDSFPIGAELHAGVGVRAVVRPLQLVDFVVGFVGIDLDPQLNKKAY